MSASRPDARPRRRRLLPTLLLGLLVSAALLVIAAFAVGHLDADRLRPRVQALFARATGRALTVAGPLHLSLLPTPGLVADDVTVANLPGGSRPAMASVRRVSATFDLAALLAGRIHVDRLALTEPDLLLELVHGVPNWRLHPADRPATAASGTPAPPHVSSNDLPFGSLDATGGHLGWRGLPVVGSGAIALDTVHVRRRTDDTLTASVAARHDAARLTASVSTGAAALAADAATVPLRATVSLGDGRLDHLQLEGTLARTGGTVRLALTVSGALDHLADLHELFPHAGLPAASHVRLDTALRQDPSGRWLVLSGHATAADADLSRLRPGLSASRLALAVPGPGQPLALDADGRLGATPFTVAGTAGTASFWTATEAGSAPLDLRATLGADRLSVAGTVSRAAGRRVPDALDGALVLALPNPGTLAALGAPPRLPAIDATGRLRLTRGPTGDADATLDASRLVLDGAGWPSSTLAARWDPGAPAWRVTDTLVGAPKPWLDWSEAGPAPARVAIRLDGHDLPAAPLARLLFAQRSIDGRLDVSATLQAQRNAAGLALRSLNGPATARLTDAAIDAASVESALGAVLRTAHLPRGLGAAGHLRCLTATGTFQDGAFQLAHLSADAGILSLTGSGLVDLPNDQLSLRIDPVLRLGRTGLGTAVALAGPLDAPTASLQAGTDGRVGFSIGRTLPTAGAGCGPAIAAKPPKALDLLRGLGLLR